MADSVVEQSLNPVDTAKAVRQRKGQPRQQARSTKEIIRTPTGCVVTISSAKKASYHEVEQALEYALEDIRHRISNGVQAI